ncbi:MAG: prolipoprotein diacylglyceryl transferase [Candidatus Dasytiphilus stammeri]
MSTPCLFFSSFSPVVFSIGPVDIYWYGIMYLISFIFTLKIALSRINLFCSKKELEYLIYIGFLAGILGGRIGYVVFYNFYFFIKNPLEIFQIWKGGMSFHGGVIGVLCVILCFSLMVRKTFLQVSDFMVPLVPLGLGAGRIGNFINGELWGRVTIHTPWAMIFPRAYPEDVIFVSTHPQYLSLLEREQGIPRHPSQLYEFFLEGVLLYIILKIFTCKIRPIGTSTGLFLIIYGIFRIIGEFYREPDIQIGLLYNFLTIGQIFSLPMIGLGLLIILRSYYSSSQEKDKISCHERISSINE